MSGRDESPEGVDTNPLREEETTAPTLPDDRAAMRRLSRRGFVWGGVAAACTYATGHWLFTRREEGGAPWPFRTALRFNEDVWEDAFSPHRLAPEYPPSRVDSPRQNGDEGLGLDFDPADWRLRVEGVHGRNEPLVLTLAQIQAMPHREMTTELFCIEGWSIVQRWKGVPLVEMMKRYPPRTRSGNAPDLRGNPADLVPYVAMETPDGGYYVGLDMPSCLHPQTMLAWELNGEPLTLDHGAPLRLVVPTKYGIKNIKRVGTIRYTADRPKDFWAEQGYDWYAGL